MSNVETRIKEWRVRMTQALPQRDETLAELEDHLREHFTTAQRQGKSEEEAFALALERVGEPHAIAREFSRMPAGWHPGLILLPMMGLIWAFYVGFSLWHWSRGPLVSELLVASFFTSTAGYLGVLGLALIAMTALLKSVRRPLSERERLAVRRMLGKLALLAGVFVAIGWVLGTLWQSQSMSNNLAWPYHLRLAGLLVSVALLLFTYSRPATSDRVRWLTAILPFLFVSFSTFGRFIRVANISVAWVCVLFIIVQAILVLPRFRIRIERLHEPLR